MKITVDTNASQAASGPYAGLRLVKTREQAKTVDPAPAKAAAPATPKVTTAQTRPSEPIQTPAAARADVRAAIAESQGRPAPATVAIASKSEAQIAREKEARAARIWDQAIDQAFNGKSSPPSASSPAASAVWDKAYARVFPNNQEK